MIDIKTAIDAELVKAQQVIDALAAIGQEVLKKASGVVTIAANTADGGVGATADLTTSLESALAVAKEEAETAKKAYNDLLATHPSPPADAAPLPLATPPTA